MTLPLSNAPKPWRWHTDPLGYKDVCFTCHKNLRSGGDAIVVWTNGHNYHLGCLLDKLSADEAAWNRYSGVSLVPIQDVDVGSISHWGGVNPP